MPNSHPSHTKNKNRPTSISSHHSLHLSKRKGAWGVGGSKSRKNNGCGVNEWPFLLKNQKIVTCSIGLMYELANFLMRLTFTITITKCLFSKDPTDYIVDNLFHQ
jgi:hypothetical protein